jgi:MFS family permease
MHAMDLRNRIGLYGSYFLGVCGIGFTLPYLSLYLGEAGLSDRAIGMVSMLAALFGLGQFPIGLISDRVGTRKPFLCVALAVLAAATALLRGPHGAMWLGLLVVLFAENGICRAVVESLAGAEAAALAPPEEVATALGALRFWKPIGVIAMALSGGWIAERYGMASILTVLSVATLVGFLASLLIHERVTPRHIQKPAARPAHPIRQILRDRVLLAFVAAMILFHAANAPGGVYLGLFLRRELHAPERLLAYAFIVSMIAWLLVVRPMGRLADTWGRRPLLIAAWGIMSLRLALVALARSPWPIIAIQAFDGIANGMFAVLAGAWMSDRMADSRRAGEAQVIVGTSLVLGSALGPGLASLLVEPLGYRGLFAVLACLGLAALSVVLSFVPETLMPCAARPDIPAANPLRTSTEFGGGAWVERDARSRERPLGM